MTCPHCNADNKPSARFCNECGATLAESQTPTFFDGSEEAKPVTPTGVLTQPSTLYPATTVFQCPSCRQGNYAYEVACRYCGAELTAWQHVSPEELKRYTCWKCGGRYTLVSEYPDKGTGCIIMALGILFAPLIIGIFFILIGAQMSGAAKNRWQCRRCGLTLPA
jgi:transposase-like protein